MKILWLLFFVIIFSCTSQNNKAIKFEPKTMTTFDKAVILNTAWLENDFSYISKIFASETNEECNNDICLFNIMNGPSSHLKQIIVSHTKNQINWILFSTLDQHPQSLVLLKEMLKIKDWKKKKFENKISHIIDFRFADFNEEYKIIIGNTPVKNGDRIEYLYWGPRNDKFSIDDLFFW